MFISKTTKGVLNVVDDSFTVDRKRAASILSGIRNSGIAVQAVFDACARDLHSSELVSSLGEFANRFLVGAECGYDEGLRAINKRITTHDLQLAASSLRDHGLSGRSVFSFVIGFPFESRSDCLRTIEFASQLVIRYGVGAYLQWYNPIPGSEIWQELEHSGRIALVDFDSFGFFRSSRIFRAGVRLSDSDIDFICEAVDAVNRLSVVAHPDSPIIQFSRPAALGPLSLA